MQQWEYLVFQQDDTLPDGILNDLGAQGWELRHFTTAMRDAKTFTGAKEFRFPLKDTSELFYTHSLLYIFMCPKGASCTPPSAM